MIFISMEILNIICNKSKQKPGEKSILFFLQKDKSIKFELTFIYIKCVHGDLDKTATNSPHTLGM